MENYSDQHDFNADCAKYNFEFIPSKLQPTSRTIAIGDIHGDLHIAIQFLEIAKCIQEITEDQNIPNSDFVSINVDNNSHKYIWIGGDTQVVQVGDQVDRCRPSNDHSCLSPLTTKNDEASDIKILKFYTDINTLAMKNGGRLISLLGNHELMNVMGSMNYVSFMGILEFNNNVDITKIDQNMFIDTNNDEINELTKTGLQNRKNAFSNRFHGNRKEALNEYLACSRTSAIIIGDILFVHGGLIKKMAEAYNITDLNKIVRKWLLGKPYDDENKKTLYTIKEKKDGKLVTFDVNDRIYQIIKSKNSIFWNRILGYIESDLSVNQLDVELQNKYKHKCDTLLDDVFRLYDIGGIIIGHTPQMSAKNNGINSACGQKIWRVDIGASDAFDMFRNNIKKNVQVLEIKYKNDKPKFNILQ